MKRKQTIKLNESQLMRMVKESVRMVLKEGCDYNPSPDEYNEYDNVDEEQDINYVLNVIGKKWNELQGLNKLDKIENLCVETVKMLVGREDSTRLPIGSEPEFLKGKTIAYSYKDINKEDLYSALYKISHIAFYERELYNEKVGRLDKIIETCNREMRHDDYDN